MSENTNLPVIRSDVKAPPKINKFLRNFFFKALSARKEVKETVKAIGKLENITVIISKNKNILRAKGAEKSEDIPFTEEEMSKLISSLKVKRETIDSCKSIFVMLEFSSQKIFICQNKTDGTIREFEL